MCFGILNWILTIYSLFCCKWSFESSTADQCCVRGSIPILIKSMDVCPDYNRKFGSRYLMGDCCLPSFGCLPRTSPKFVSDWLTTLRGLLASCKTTSSAASSYRNVLFALHKVSLIASQDLFYFHHLCRDHCVRAPIKPWYLMEVVGLYYITSIGQS